MQLKNKADSSDNPLLDDPTDSPLVNLFVNTHPERENSPDRLPKQGEVTPSMPESAPDTPKQKRVSVLPFFWVVGIATVLALPSLFSCIPNVNQAKQEEAKNNIGALNRTQQSYYSEFKTFTNSLTDLGVGIKPQSVNYDYSIRTTKTSAFHYAIARKEALKSYVGAVFQVPTSEVHAQTHKEETQTIAITCEVLSPGYTTLNTPTLVKGIPTCGYGTRDLRAKSR